MARVQYRRPTLARIFLTRLLIGCLAFSVVVVGVQIGWEYRTQSKALNDELEAFAASFEPGIESAMWDFHTTLLQAQANGLGNNRKIVLVRILDEKGHDLATWRSSLNLDASDKFCATKEIVHFVDGEDRRIGTLEIHSSDKIIAAILWARLWQTTSLLVAVLGFCFLILWLTGDRLIVRPLVRFAHLVDEQICKEHGSSIELNDTAAAEIARLEDGFNLLMARINANQEKIRDHNAQLEEIVANRTRECMETERQFRTIFERANVGIVFADADGSLVSFNETFARLTGFDAASLTGSSLANYVPREMVANNDPCTDPGNGSHPDDYRIDAPLRRRDGTTIHVDMAVNVMRDELGKVVNSVAFLIDIEARVRMEAELRSAKEAAEIAARAKGDFLANMSHEIRTPMNAVIGFAGLLRRTPLSERQIGYLSKLDSSAKSLLGLITDVLDTSKIEAGKLELEHIDFDIQDVVRRTLDMVSPMADDKRLELLCNIEPQVPEFLKGDAGRLAQILTNLANNAVKFTESGTVAIQVGLQAQNANFCLLRFMVSDTGIGMDEATISRLFKPFSQADSSFTRRFGGTGLGLVISKHLVEMMGGRLEVESLPGEGSTFFFTVSLEPGSNSTHDADTPDPKRNHRGATAMDTKLKSLRRGAHGARILLVDDNELNREVAGELLRSAGAEVTMAVNGQDAVEKIESTEFDMAFMDIQMPVMDGYEATRRIRRDPRHSSLPVIAMTAHAMKGAREQCLDAGMDDFLTKPIDGMILFSAVVKWRGCQSAGSSTFDEPSHVDDPRTEQAEVRYDFDPDIIDFEQTVARVAGNRELAATFTFQFLEEYATLADQVAAFMENGVLDEAKKSAHSLKGTAGNLSMSGLYTAAKNLNDALDAGEAHGYQNLTSRLLEENRKVVEILGGSKLAIPS